MIEASEGFKDCLLANFLSIVGIVHHREGSRVYRTFVRPDQLVEELLLARQHACDEPEITFSGRRQMCRLRRRAKRDCLASGSRMASL